MHELIQRLKERAGEIYDRYKEQIREHGGIGKVLDRLRAGFGISKAGESGIEQRERRIARIVGEAERRKQEALGRESEINRAAETIGRREAKRKEIVEKLIEIPETWNIHGTDKRFADLYTQIAQRLIVFEELSSLRKIESNRLGDDYDYRYSTHVFIIKPSQVKKAEKICENMDHIIVPVDYNGAKMMALLYNGDEYYVREKLKTYEQDFWIYIDHKKQIRYEMPSVRESLDSAKTVARQREIEKKLSPEPKPTHKKEVPEPAHNEPEPEEPTMGLWL